MILACSNINLIFFFFLKQSIGSFIIPDSILKIIHVKPKWNGTCLSADLSNRCTINSFSEAICPEPSLLSHQSNVTQQIATQDAARLVRDEEEGSDKGAALNCYWFSCLNVFLQKVKSQGGAEDEVQKKDPSFSLKSKWCLLHSSILLQLSS